MVTTLSILGVRCSYDSVEVLKGLTLKVVGGEMMGLLGPNGSGKTTLLRSISRTLRPRLGAVLLDGEDIYSLRREEVARRVAMVQQGTHPTFNFTALEVVLMGRHPHIPPGKNESIKDLEVARWAMELTDSWHLAPRRINELSGGERQRVLLAKALAQEPQVLLLDEPTLHLDIAHQMEVLGLLKKLCEERGMAILAVLHDINLAVRYCEKGLLLKDGKIMAMGRMEEIITQENLKEVFSIEAEVVKWWVNGTSRPVVIPLGAILGQRVS